jgi:UDP:flavonoid glycosyltransferase YjiC (YdhE family)
MRAQGEEVVLAGGADVAPVAASRSLDFRAAGPPFDEWFARLRARTRGIPGDGLPPSRIEHYFLPRLFGEVGLPAMLDDLLEVARELRPDVIVHDPLALAGPLVAAALGIPAVHHTIGPLTDPDVLQLITDVASPVWREFGLDVPPAVGLYAGTTLTICPPSLDPASRALPGARPLRPAALPVRNPQPLPFVRSERPLVYVTLGTFSNSNLDVFRILLRSLDGLGVDVLATVGRDNDPALLQPLPANVHVERFVPQADVLPHCALCIHHAGSGTMFGILAHGLPSVVAPQSADNFVNAARVAAAGAGRVLQPGEVNEESVRAAVVATLDDAAMRRAAERIAAEIAAMPPAEDVAAQLREEVSSR